MNIVRESIFSSSVRAFCIAFFAIIGIAIALIPISFAFGAIFSQKGDISTMNKLIVPDSGGKKAIITPSKPVILRIDLRGVIGLNELTSDKIKSQFFDAKNARLKGAPVKAMLIYMDTPGGIAITGHSIYQAIKDYKEKHQIPVYTFVDGLCASAGMEIACATDKIYATDLSIIGSVGVVSPPAFNIYDALNKIGVSSLTISNGKDKDALNPLRPWTPQESDQFVNISDYYYQQFLDIVVAARPVLTKEKLINEYGAQVFVAPLAKEYGYIDETGFSLESVTKELAKEADIEDNYQVVLMKAKTKLSDLFKMQSPLITGKLTHSLNLTQALNEYYQFGKAY